MRTFTIMALLLMVSCSAPTTEKYQTTRDNIVDVSDKVVKVDIGGGLLLGEGAITVVGDYVLINDFNSKKELLHILDRQSLTHTWSGLREGRGRGEVLSLSRISADPNGRRFYTLVQRNAASFDIDSMINVRDYTHTTHAAATLGDDELGRMRSLCAIAYANDTLSFANILYVNKNGNISINNGTIYSEGGGMGVRAFNTTEGGIKDSAHSYPDGIEPFFFGTGSVEHNIIVEGHQNKDLLTLSDLDGNLICNVYGPDYSSSEKLLGFCDNTTIIKDHIFTIYSGEKLKGNQPRPSRITIFNLKGDYIKSVELGVAIYDYTYDAKGNRLLLFIEDEERPVAYINISHIL